MTFRPAFAAAALAAALALPAAAQPATLPPPPPPPPAERAARTLDRRVDYLDGALDLTDAQEAQIRRILSARQAQVGARMEQARADYAARRPAERMTREQMRARMEQMRANQRQHEDSLSAEIRGLLNTDQARRFDEIRAEEREHVESRVQRGRGNDRRRGEAPMPRPRGSRGGQRPGGQAPDAPRN